MSILSKILSIIVIFFIGSKSGSKKEKAKNLDKENKNLKHNIKNAQQSKKNEVKNKNLDPVDRVKRMRKRRTRNN
jgi:hypothetical protein